MRHSTLTRFLETKRPLTSEELMDLWAMRFVWATAAILTIMIGASL